MLLALVGNSDGKLDVVSFAHHVREQFQKLTAAEAADLFVQTAFMSCACEAIIEQHWLHRHEGKSLLFSELLAQSFAQELRSLDFLNPLLSSASIDSLGVIESKAETILATITVTVMRTETGYYREFCTRAVSEMFKLSAGPFGILQNSLYRAFDVLDDVFGLDYSADRQMKFEGRDGERVFAGAGLGVQSSYLSLFVALQKVELSGHVVDLGSGYGRLGLILGCLYPDVKFSGFEYVAHRVECAKAAAEHMGIAGRVRFFEQDLSDPLFIFPQADVYYLYDPFTPETYVQVLSQLKEIGGQRPLTVITKGGALASFGKSVEGNCNWSPPELLDEGTLGLFRSLR